MRASRWLTIVAVTAVVVAGAIPASAAPPESISNPCPTPGSSFEVRSWTSIARDGSGSTTLRRVKIQNGCVESALLGFYAIDAFLPTSTLVIEPGASGSLGSTELGEMGWDVPTLNTFSVGITAGATSSDWCTMSLTRPTWILASDGSLVPYSCA